MDESTVHTLTRSDGCKVTKRFKVGKNSVTFQNVKIADSGTYTISCCNMKGEKGEAELELEIKPSQIHGHNPLGKSASK